MSLIKHNFLTFNAFVLFCLLSCFMEASPIKSDIQKIDQFIEQKKYTEGIDFTTKAFQKYLEAGDIGSAYSFLLKQLECLHGEGKREEFLEISGKIKKDLDPNENIELLRRNYELRCSFLMMQDEVALEKEYLESMAFEKKYGTNDSYAYMVLIYVSRRSPTGEERILDDMRRLHEIENLHESNENKCLNFRLLANRYISKDEAKADSLFRLAEEFVDESRDEIGKASFHRDYSNFLGNTSRYALSIQHSLKALEHYEKFENLYLPRVKLLGSIATKFEYMGQLNRAREYMDAAIDLAEKNNLKYRNGLGSRNAEILFLEGKKDLAIEECRRSFEFFKKSNKKVAVGNLCKLGKIYLSKGELQEAKRIKEEIISFIEDNKLSQLVFFNNVFFGDLAIYEKDWSSAQAHFERALNTDLTVYPKSKLNIYEGLRKVHEAKQQFKIANEYINLHKQLRDSLSLISNEQLALSMEAEYDRAKKDNEISMLNSENEIHQLKLSGQRKFLIFTSCSLFAFLILSLLLLRLFRKVKSQNAIINKSLEEKNTLLKEIHHRVKNNLQLVSSLLTLQSRGIEDEKAIEAINVSKSRVRSMALIHQDLYSRDNLRGIGMKNYIENLSQELFATYQIGHQNIILELDIDDVYLDVDTIIPIGLIINELMANALKFAFAGQDDGMLKISFTEKNNKLVLDVIDNGVGLGEQKVKRSNSFGNKLIKTLTAQLNGEVNIDGRNGTHVHLEFNDYKLAS